MINTRNSTGTRVQQQCIEVTRPFFDPIGEFDDCSDGVGASTALIRVKYFQSSTPLRTARRVDVKFRHLDLLGG